MILKITSWILHVFLINTLLLNFLTIFMIANIFWCIFTTMTQTTSITNVLVIIKNHLHFITTWFSSEIIDIIFYAFQTKRTVNLSLFIDYFILYFKIAIIVAHIIWWDSFLIYQKMKWDYKIITMNKKKVWWFWMKSQDELFYEYYRLGFFKIAIDHIIWWHYFFHTL